MKMTRQEFNKCFFHLETKVIDHINTYERYLQLAKIINFAGLSMYEEIGIKNETYRAMLARDYKKLSYDTSLEEFQAKYNQLDLSFDKQFVDKAVAEVKTNLLTLINN